MYRDYDRNLITELYNIHKNLKISMTELFDMPVMYRRELIKVHNHIIDEENEALRQKTTR